MCSSITSSFRSASVSPRAAIHDDNLPNAFIVRRARPGEHPVCCSHDSNGADLPPQRTRELHPISRHDKPPLQERGSLTQNYADTMGCSTPLEHHLHPDHRHNPKLRIADLSPHPRLDRRSPSIVSPPWPSVTGLNPNRLEHQEIRPHRTPLPHRHHQAGRHTFTAADPLPDDLAEALAKIYGPGAH